MYARAMFDQIVQLFISITLYDLQEYLNDFPQKYCGNIKVKKIIFYSFFKYSFF